MKTVMAEWKCTHLLCFSSTQLMSLMSAVSLCRVSVTRPALGIHTSRTGNGYYNFMFSGSGKILHFWRMFGMNCWTKLQYNLKNVIMEPVWILWENRGRGAQPIFFVSWPDSAPFAKWQPHQTAFGHSFTWTVILLKPILAVLISWITFLRRHVI